MSGNDWGAGIAIAVIVVFVWVVGVLIGRAENYAFIQEVCLSADRQTDYDKSEKPNSGEAKGNANIVSPTSLPPLSNEQQSRCDRYTEYYYKQHRVGRLFDDADDAVAWGTWAAALMAMFAVYLLCRTLRATERATRYAAGTLLEAKRATTAAISTTNETTRLGELNFEEARKATAAANKTTEVTREMGQIQVQAYVIVEAATVKLAERYPSGKKLDPEGMKFELICRNTGQSPARNIIANYTIEALIPSYKEDGVSIESYGMAHSEKGRTLIPDVGAQSPTVGVVHSREFSDETSQALTKQQLLIEISGQLSWINEFGDPQFQYFSFTTDDPLLRVDFFGWDKEHSRSSEERLAINMTALGVWRRK